MLRNGENTIISLEDARKSTHKTKALFVVNDMSDMSNIKGHISYISDDEDSYNDLIYELHKIKRANQQAMIIGSYENGGAIGVQYNK